VSFEELGDILLRIDGSLDGLTFALTEAVAAIETFAEVAEHKMHDAGKESGKKFSDGMEEEVAKRGFIHSLDGALAKLGGVFGNIGGGILGGLGKIFMPAMWTTLIYGASQAAVALAPMVGILGALPAAASTAAAGLITLKMAFHGVGDALKAGASGDMQKYAEAMKKLAPAAQEAVKQMLALRPAIDAMHRTIQQGFFSQWAHDIKVVGDTYLPILRHELGGIATALGGTVHEIAAWLRVPDTVKSITSSLDNMRRGWENASHAFLPFLSGLNDLVEVGSKFLPGLGAGFAALGDKFSAFMAEVASNGSLEAFIQAGLDTLKLLVPLLKDVWNILHPILRALQESGGGGLGILGTLLHALAEFLNSATGMELIATVINVLNTLFGVLGDVLAELLPALAQLLVALGPTLVALILALEPALLDIAKAITVIVTWITPLLMKLEGLAPIVQTLAQILTALLIPAMIRWGIVTGAGLVKDVMGLGRAIYAFLVPAFIADADAATAAAIANAAATWEILLVLAAVAALAYGIYELVKHWNTVWAFVKKIAGDVAGFFVGIWHWMQRTFDDVWGHIKDAAKAVADFFVRIWDDVTGAISAALDWIGAIPGKVADYLQRLPGIIYDIMKQFIYNVGYGIGATIREFLLLPGQVWHMITELWAVGKRLWLEGLDAIVDFASQLPHRIRVFWDEMRHDVAAAFDAIRHAIWVALVATWDGIKWLFTDGISKAWGALKGFGKNVWDFLKGLGPMAKNAAVDAAHWLYNAGRDMITGLINGAKSMFSAAWNTIRDFAASLFHGFMDGIQGKSPSRLFMKGGESIVSGLVKGILDNAADATSAVASLIGFTGARGLQGPAFAFGNALGSSHGGGGGGGAIVLHVHTHNYLDGKELHAGLIEPAQRYLARTGTTGLETPRTAGGVRK